MTTRRGTRAKESKPLIAFKRWLDGHLRRRKAIWTVSHKESFYAGFNAGRRAERKRLSEEI